YSSVASSEVNVMPFLVSSLRPYAPDGVKALLFVVVAALERHEFFGNALGIEIEGAIGYGVPDFGNLAVVHFRHGHELLLYFAQACRFRRDAHTIRIAGVCGCGRFLVGVTGLLAGSPWCASRQSCRIANVDVICH